MIRGGGATTVEPAGTSVWTTAPAPILTPSPIRMPPTTTAPAPIRQFRPICGPFLHLTDGDVLINPAGTNSGITGDVDAVKAVG